MADNFRLVLDTTGPTITMAAPSYTMPGILTDILVTASEDLIINHEAYIIDSHKKRTDVIFLVEGQTMTLSTNFADVAPGVCTIYVRAYDSVMNPSNLASKSILLHAPSDITVSISAKPRGVTISRQARSVGQRAQARAVGISKRGRSVSISGKSKKVEVRSEWVM